MDTITGLKEKLQELKNRMSKESGMAVHLRKADTRRYNLLLGSMCMDCREDGHSTRTAKAG